jgi:ribosomal protein S18 acetylase RimI-like enzyme
MKSESDNAIAAMVEMIRRESREPIFVDTELSRRLELAEAETSAECARQAFTERPGLGACIETIGGGRAIFLGVGSPLTQSIGVGMSGEVTADDFSRLEDFYFSRGVSVNAETSPFAHPTLFDHFARSGYRASEHSSTLVRRIETSVWPLPPAKLTISEVPPDHNETWVQTVSQGFADSFPVTDELTDLMRLFALNPNAKKYLAFVDGTPAGAGAISFHDRIAGLFGASTLPEFRRRGIQRELILARLEAAFRAGCEFALSFALPGSSSEKNILRYGFRVAYTRTKFTRELPK